MNDLPKRKRKKKDNETLIQEELENVFKKVEVRRYDRYSIRVRITDASFAGKPWDERERAVHAVIEKMPEDVQVDITMLILNAPGEVQNPLLSYEFENPSKDRL